MTARTARTRTVEAGCVAVILLLAGCGAEPGEAPPARSAVEMLVGGSEEGFERVAAPKEFRFPDDFGPHPRYRTEWWYVTVNVRDDRGRPYGVQLAIFRAALSPHEPESESAWATNQAYMAHFAVTDSARGVHRSFERFARGAAGLAGASASPFRVWLEDWEISQVSGSVPPLELAARDGDVAVELLLEPGKPRVLQGDRGFSVKSGGAGNASYYYSYTRLPVSGTVSVEGVPTSVEGHAWMDREWSTSSLSPDQTGWDWFGLQLADGRDLMVFRLRAEGDGPEVRDGTLVEVDGRSRRLDPDDLRLSEVRRWASPDGSARYPVAWRLAAPAEDLDLYVVPLLDDQEVRHTFRYWEGAVRVLGPDGVTNLGRGYLEMTGYGVDEGSEPSEGS